MSLKYENQTLLVQLQKYSPSWDSKSSAALVWGSLAPRRAPRGRRAKCEAKASKVALAPSSPTPPKTRPGPAHSGGLAPEPALGGPAAAPPGGGRS